MDLYLYNYYHYYYITIVTIIQAHLWICTTIIYITLLFSNDNGGWIDLFVSGYVCLDFNVKSWLVDFWEWIDMDGYHFCQYVYIWIWVFNVDYWLFDEWGGEFLDTRQEEVGPTFVPPASSSILNKLNFGVRLHIVLRCGYALHRWTHIIFHNIHQMHFTWRRPWSLKWAFR